MFNVFCITQTSVISPVIFVDTKYLFFTFTSNSFKQNQKYYNILDKCWYWEYFRKCVH